MRTKSLFITLLAVAGALALQAATSPTATAALRPELTRAPYLTDVVRTGTSVHVTIDWATDRSRSSALAVVKRRGTAWRTGRVVKAVRAAIVVGGVPEYQWRAGLRGLEPGTRYVYRVFFARPRLDLLGSDPSPWFRTPPRSRTAAFSFAVLGDWGATDSSGGNRYQAGLDTQLAASGARFALSTGDVAYPAGTQTNYGDLQQTGVNVSAVFAPPFFAQVGNHLPLFTAPGNHGFNKTLLDVWPQATAARRSGGRYRLDTYAVAGTRTASYPSVWYAFTVGRARFYVLTAAWADTNAGLGGVYKADYLAHWTSSSPEYRWLAADLAAHRRQLKVAVFHFPLYSDNAFEPSDPYLHGRGSLAALLSRYRVRFVFNGHAHVYERNTRQLGDSFVSYVTGTGGEALQSIGPGSSFDAYGIGWNAATGTGRATGSAPVPASPAQVFSFLLVTVNGSRVTTEGVNSLGEHFDKVSYQF